VEYTEKLREKRHFSKKKSANGNNKLEEGGGGVIKGLGKNTTHSLYISEI
jgi:hypothetical protein